MPVGVAVDVAVDVAVLVGVGVNVFVGVGVGVKVGVAVGVLVGVGVGGSVGRGVITSSGGRISTISDRDALSCPWLLATFTVIRSPFRVALKPPGGRSRATGRADGVPLTVSVRTSSLPDCW